MTKKDYELIAKVFRQESENLVRLISFKGGTSDFNDGQLQEMRTIARNMATALKQDNSKFDRNKFYEACFMVKD